MAGHPHHHHHHNPLPLRTAAHSGPLCCQASWCKTGVGGREWWMIGTGRQRSWGDRRERKAARQSKTPPSDSHQRSMWIHLLNGCLMMSIPDCVLGARQALHSARELQLCVEECGWYAWESALLWEREGDRQKGMGVHPGKRPCQEWGPVFECCCIRFKLCQYNLANQHEVWSGANNLEITLFITSKLPDLIEILVWPIFGSGIPQSHFLGLLLVKTKSVHQLYNKLCANVSPPQDSLLTHLTGKVANLLFM